MYVLSKLVSLFLFPYPLFLILCFFAGRKLPRGRFRKIFNRLLVLVVFISVPAVASYSISLFETQYTQVNVADLKKPLVVILGGYSDIGAKASSEINFNGAADRLFAGLALLHENKRARAIITGGQGFLATRKGLNEGSRVNRLSETNLTREWLRSHSLGREYLEAKKVFFELKARNTFENAVNTYQLVQKKKMEYSATVIVTSAFHMPRSIAIFKKTGFKKVKAYPVDFRSRQSLVFPESFVPGLDGLGISTIAFKELVGYIAYFVMGRI